MAAPLIAFVVGSKPLSYNAFRDSERKAAYTRKLRDAYWDVGRAAGTPDAPHYGIVYHLHRGEDLTDVDNISKPVWDALKGVAYEDDAAVRLRIAGKLRIGRTLPTGIDVTRVPRETLRRLMMTGKERFAHIIYVELGTLKNAMFGFGMGA